MVINQKVDKKKLIEDKLTDYDLFSYYFGDFKLSSKYHSPLRRDNSPSFSFYNNNYGGISAKDFSTGDNYTPIKFLMELYNLTYRQALDKICSDFGLVDIDFKADIVKKKEHEKVTLEKKPSIIQIQPKKFSNKDIEYWESYGIFYPTLKNYNVFSVNKAWLNKSPLFKKDSELCFAYYFEKSNHIKLMFPERPKKDKWVSNTNNELDLQGYWQADIKNKKPRLLIITSSMKEVMFLRENNIDAVALNGENHKPLPDLVRHLSKYCLQIRTLFDYDVAGEKASNFWKEQYGILPLEKPSYITCLSKDVTDMYKQGDREGLERFIKEIKQI